VWRSLTTMVEINHTWELKCQHCHPCQQCGLFRRLILDLGHTEEIERGREKQRAWNG